MLKDFGELSLKGAKILRQIFVIVLALYICSGCSGSKLAVTKQADAQIPSSYSRQGDAEKQDTPTRGATVAVSMVKKSEIWAACEQLAVAYRIQRKAAVAQADCCGESSYESLYESKDSGIFLAVLPPVFRDRLTFMNMKKWRVGQPVEGQSGCWALLPSTGQSFELAYADYKGRIARRKVSIHNKPSPDGDGKKWPTQLMLQDLDEDGHEEAFFISYDATDDKVAVVTPKNGELQDMLSSAENPALYRKIASKNAFEDANGDGKIDVILEDEFKSASTGHDARQWGQIRIPMFWDSALGFSLTHPDVRRELDEKKASIVEPNWQGSVTQMDLGDVMLLKTLGACTADIRKAVRCSHNENREWSPYSRTTTTGKKRSERYTQKKLATYRHMMRVASGYIPVFNIEPMCGFKDIKNDTAGGRGDCHQGDLAVSFAADLKKLKNITCINGTLTIEKTKFNKIAASALKEVHGNVVIAGNARLKDLLFPQLEFVEGDLSIFDNSKLGHLNSFKTLTKIGGGLYLENNPALRQINGFKEIEWIGDDLVLADLPQVASFMFF